MKQHPSSSRKSIHAVSWISAAFFWVFSMIYLAVFQGDLLFFKTESLFAGNLQYNSWIGALIITALLWLLQRGMIKLVKFGSKEYAFSYFPSFLILGILTYYSENYSLSLAVCVFGGAVLLSYFFFMLWGRKYTKLSIISNVNLNLQALLLLCCVTVAIGNTSEDLHHELSMKRAIEKGDYIKVLKIGKKSLSVSPKMADYRIRAMIATRQVGELLFEYPQYYVSLPVLSQKDNNAQEAFDLVATSLLLNKNIDGFYDKLSKDSTRYQAKNKYYSEAITLYQYLHPEVSPTADRENPDNHFKTFMDLRAVLKAENNKPVIEKNKMRREFGTTYWYYYFYNN